MAAKKSYVVEHTAVMFGPRPELDEKGKPTGGVVAPKRPVVSRGELLAEEELGDQEARDRLLRAGAVRPATKEEAAAGAAQPMHPAVQAALAQRQSELDRLRRLVGDLQDRAAAVLTLRNRSPQAPAAAGPPEEHPAAKEMLAASDAEVASLRERAEALMAQLGELQGRTADTPPGAEMPPGEQFEGVVENAPPPPPAAPEPERHRRGK